MSLISGSESLRAVLAYGDLPAQGNSGDRIIVASLGSIASWNGSAWVLGPVTTIGSVAVLGTAPTLVGVDGMGSNAAPLAGVQSALNAVYAKIDAILAALDT